MFLLILKRTLVVAIGLYLGACASASKPVSPAGITELTIESKGQRMAGLLYSPSGPGPHPTVILLHGYPGNEKNLDLAQAIRRSGWNVLFFHYRGSWGSEGEFSFIGAEQDVQAVIQYIRSEPQASKLNVNTSHISTVGHSMGGHMAVAGLLDNPTVRCAVALDGANMGANAGLGLFRDPRIGKVWRDYSDTLFMLNGWSGAKATQEMEKYGAKLDLVPRAVNAANRPILLLAADTDVIPMNTHINPLFNALEEHSDVTTLTVIKDDHSFSTNRVKMIKTVDQFLRKNCR